MHASWTYGDPAVPPASPRSAAWAAPRSQAIVIQGHWRGYKARCLAWKIREELGERRRHEEQEGAVAAKDGDARHAREIQRRVHPKTFEDFEILYNELENW